MSFKAGSFVDTAALESSFVATKASPSLQAKNAPSNMAWRAQPTTPFSPHPVGPRSLSPDASHEVSAARGVGVLQAGRRRGSTGTGTVVHRSSLELHPPHAQGGRSTQLPLIDAGRGRSMPQPTAHHSARVRRAAAVILIKPSTLEENGHEDENGNVVSSICVGLGASGFDLYDSHFHSLESIDLGDNRILFSDTAAFPSLKMLNLYCNGVKSLEHPSSAFKSLEVLNLSFNVITMDSLMPLFAIKSLVVLDLSFNSISRIPNRWHSLPVLKILSLERNGLYHADTFAYLSLAPSLQELNLNSNKLSCVPAACSSPGRFPQLLFISLVDNHFAHEQDVVALSFVPSVQQVDLWNNPMSNNSGARARSRHALKSSRSPSPEIQAAKQQVPGAAGHDALLRVMTPANFERRALQPSASHSPAPVVSYSSRPKRAMADIEQEARDVFRDGMASLNNSTRNFGSTACNLRKLKSILNASLVGSNDSVILTNQTTVMNPTLSLIERMKVVGTDIERRKSNVPDRFFSHFYFGPDKHVASEKLSTQARDTHSEAIKRMLMAVKQQHRAASHDGPKHQVARGAAAMHRTLDDATAILPEDNADAHSNVQKWGGFDGD